MAAPLRRSDPRRDPQVPVVSMLRLSALNCRTARRGSIEACALLDPDAGAADFATALARALPQMMTRRPVLWRPGSSGLSFDETWLLALARAIQHGDGTSERFLMRSRVRPQARAALRLILAGLADRLGPL